MLRETSQSGTPVAVHLSIDVDTREEECVHDAADDLSTVER
jgi:hypothetical protein